MFVTGCGVVDALQRIMKTMGATYWKLDEDSCQLEMVGFTPQPPTGSEQSIGCKNFSEKNQTVEHVISMYISRILLLNTLNEQCIIYIYGWHCLLDIPSWSLYYDSNRYNEVILGTGRCFSCHKPSTWLALVKQEMSALYFELSKFNLDFHILVLNLAYSIVFPVSKAG